MAQRDKHGLTRSWKAFCDEFRVNGHNATQAYKTAYPKSTTKAAEANGSKLLRNNKVIGYLAVKADRAEISADITEERIKLELARVGFLDVRKLYNKDGTIKPVHELDDDTAAAVSGMKLVRRFTGFDDKGKREYQEYYEYRTVPKEGALRMLGQNKKMFTDKVELDVTGLVVSISK